MGIQRLCLKVCIYNVYFVLIHGINVAIVSNSVSVSCTYISAMHMTLLSRLGKAAAGAVDIPFAVSCTIFSM